MQEGRTMAMDEGIELESVKAPLSEAGELMSLWQDDDGSVGLAFASGVKPEAWGAMLMEAVVEIAEELAGGDEKRRGDIVRQILGKMTPP
jgi:hypothetical protein